MTDDRKRKTGGEVELLPLPAIGLSTNIHDYAQAYARANVDRALAESRAECQRLRGLLGECYVAAGADTDGNPPSHHAEYAVRAVQELRRDYDAALNLEPRND